MSEHMVAMLLGVCIFLLFPSYIFLGHIFVAFRDLSIYYPTLKPTPVIWIMVVLFAQMIILSGLMGYFLWHYLQELP